MKEGRIEHDGVRLHYVEWGTAQRSPALLLLHGLSSNALVWERIAAHLPDRRLVALDQRSHGSSGQPPTGYTMSDLVADAAHAIEALGLGRPLVVGHSWGASVALALAAAHPELAAGLALVDGGAISFSRFMTWEQAAQRMQPPLPTFPDLAAAAADQARYLGDAWGDDLQGFVRAGLIETPDGGWRSTLTTEVRYQILRDMYDLQPELLFADVRGPILLAMAGELWQGAPTEFAERRRRSADEVQELRPDVQVRWYESRHDIPLIRPVELAADLERTAIAAGFADVAVAVAALVARPGVDWERPAQGDEGQWRAHDLLAHLSSTNASLAALIGAPPPAPDAPPFDPSRWNAGQIRRRQDRTAAELADEMRVGAERAQAALMAASLDAPTGAGQFRGQPLRETMSSMLQHQRDHLTELKAALA